MLLVLLFYVLASSTANATRGMDIISRTVFLIFHFLLSFVVFKDIYLSLILTAGIYSWLSKGWGNYFQAFAPQYKAFRDRHERSVGFINKICDKFIVVNLEPFDKKAARNWGTLGMSLRAFIFSIPLFIMLALYLHNPWISLLSIPMLLQGIVYRKINDPSFIIPINFRTAEKISASLLAILIIGAMYV